MGCGPERILELWLGIGVNHVAFYGLWPGMTSLELWLGLASVSVWVCWLWPVRMGPDGLPSSMVADEFGSRGTLRTMFVLGNSIWRYGVW